MSPPDARAAISRWLIRQLRQRTPEREHLEAAVAHDDPAEFQRVLRRTPLSAAQQRYVDDLIRRWEETADGR